MTFLFSCSADIKKDEVWISDGVTGESKLNYKDSNDMTMGILVGEYVSTQNSVAIIDSLENELKSSDEWLTKEDLIKMMKAKYFVIYDGLDLPLDTIYLKDKEE